MQTVDGNTIIRVGSEDPVIWNLLQDDGETPIDLTGQTSVELRLEQLESPFTVKSFSTGGGKISVVSEANGQVKLSQVAADFDIATSYKFYFKYILADTKVRFVPENINYKLTVIDDI